MEALAVIACVAAVVSSFRDGGAILDRIKQRRRTRNAPPPTKLLEESLAKGALAVDEAKESGIERFGPRYAVGDKIALDSLKDILISLQSSLLKHLLQAQDDDCMTDFRGLVDVSDIERLRTVNVLNDLYMRVATAAQIVQVPFGSFIYPQGQNLQLLPPAPLSITNHTAGQLVRNTEAPDDPSTSPTKPKGTPRTSPKLPFLDRFRRKSSAAGDGLGTANISPSPTVQAKDDTFHTGNFYDSSSMSPLTPPHIPVDESNPRKQGPERRNYGGTIPEKSMSRATTLVPSIIHRMSTLSNASISVNGRMISPHDTHGGFCKGAYKLQTHENDGMKITPSKTDESYYWACCSSKCAFEGLARLEAKLWAFDNTVREACGIRYRWSFLAKAHVPKAHVVTATTKPPKYDYGCVFCIYDGFACPVFHGITEFLEHVATHRGQPLAGAVLQRIECINDRRAKVTEDFDVNLTPLGIEPETNIANLFESQVILQPAGAASSNQPMSWPASDAAMASINPWNDVTSCL